jgi:hypothetical protein
MNKEWHPDELARHWLLSPHEHDLLGESGAARLNFAILLKAFQLDGRFPERRGDIAESVVAFVSRQLGVLPESYFEEDWSDRTQRFQRAQVREHCGFHAFRSEDEAAFVEWLSERIVSPNPEAEALKLSAYGHLLARKLEPPGPDRLRRLLDTAVARRKQRLVSDTAARLSSLTRTALDALVKTGVPESDTDQLPLFPVRSELAAVKDGAGAVKVETVLGEINKLKKLRALELPDSLFHDVPGKLVTHYRQRAATEPPRELRRHPPEMRYTLLAALCWQRQREITDTLVELLIHIAQRVGARAEKKVDGELMEYAKKVLGKTKLLYKVAKAATGHPDGAVKEVIFPAVSEGILQDLIEEVESHEGHEHRVKLVARASYGHHYRRIVPTLLEVLSFQCNNDRHRPVMDALALLDKYRDHKAPVFPENEKVPLNGVVRNDWQELVVDDKHGGGINRITYEWCVLTALREKVRCKELW